MGRPAPRTCLPLPVPQSRTQSACLSQIPAPSRGCAWLRPRPRIPQRSPQPAHPNTCSELQIFIAAAAGPRRGLGAGSALCWMLRDAARAGRLLDRLFHHVAGAAAAKNRDVGGGWYPEQRCGKGLQMAAPGSLKPSKLFLCPFQPHGNVVDEADCQFKINSLGIE